MPEYIAPLDDMNFLINDLLGCSHEELDQDTIEAILEQASKLAQEVLAPLNQKGDIEGASLVDGKVKTAQGFKEAYKEYCAGGWNAVPFDPEFGGQGLPYSVAFAVQEMWQAANMSFGLCPLLNQGAVEAIAHHGSQEQKEYYLENLISGKWTGTMNLTEPSAGSDLGLLSAKAVLSEENDGSYKISGQKIFITYGDHDMAENIIHLVLARTPDAPEDVKGISLFIVPKFLEDGSENTLSCIGLEHKLGIHASPTCTMEFEGAKGYLIGELHHGLKYMFTMMNNARLSVGLQGVAIAQSSYQAALNYAQERVQGKSFKTKERVAIAEHADVKRMLLMMKSQIEAGRALTYQAAHALDQSKQDEKAQAVVDLLTPIVKSWCTDMACSVSSLGIQIHGGMGFIEETGAAQYYRDARILPIYEGTNGIQAADLVFRKIILDQGKIAQEYMDHLLEPLSESAKNVICEYSDALGQATKTLLELSENKEMDKLAAIACDYLNGFALVAGAALLLQKAQLLKDYEETAFFFCENILPHAKAYLRIST